MPMNWRGMGWNLGVGVVYYFVAQLSFLLPAPTPWLATLWLPTGVFLAGVILTAKPQRGGLVGVLLLVDFLTRLQAGTPWGWGGIYAVIAAGQAVLTCRLLEWWSGRERFTLQRGREFLGWLVLGVGLGGGVSALGAAGATELGPNSNLFWETWFWWMASSLVGNLLITPFLVSWVWAWRTPRSEWRLGRWIEEILLYGIFMLVGFKLLELWYLQKLAMAVIPFSILPFLMWGTLRFGVRGNASLLLILAPLLVPVAGFETEWKISILPGASDDILFSQLWLSTLFLPGYILAVVMAERKRIRAALETSERSFRQIFEEGPVGMATTGLANGRFRAANPIFCQMMGYTEEELKALSFKAITHPEFRSSGRDAVRQLMEDEINFYRSEKQYVRKNGEVFWAHLDLKKIVSDDGLDSYALVVVQEITERRRIEQALKTSEVRFRKVFEDGPTGIAMARFEDGVLFSVNRVLCEMLGYEEAELRSMTFRDITHPDYWDIDREAVDQLVNGTIKIHETEKQYVKKNGEVIWAHRSLTRIDGTGREGAYAVASILDVTDRKKAEDAVRLNEGRYRSLFQLSPDGVLVCDRGGIIREMNDSFCRMLGYERKELIGLDPSKIVDPSEVDRIEGTIAEICGGASYRQEWRMKRKDGSIIMGEVSATTLPDGNLVASIRDITERKRAEEAIKETEGRFRSLFDAASDGISHTDPHGRFLDLNRSFHRMLGYDEGELVGLNIADILDPAMVRQLARSLRMVTESPDEIYEWRVKRKDGLIIPVEVTATLLPDGNMLGIVRDVSARKAAEVALRESEGRFRKVFERAPVGIAVVKLADGLLNNVNPALCQMIGYTANELQSITFMDVTHPDDRESTRLMVAQLAAAEIENHAVEKRYLHKNGNVVWTYRTVTRIVSEGTGEVYALAMVLDITERKRADDAIVVSEGRYRSLFDISPDGIVVSDRAGVISAVNASACRMLGYTRDELIGSKNSDIVDDGEVDRVAPETAEVNEGGEYRREWTIKRKDGSTFMADVSAVELPEGNLLGTIRDVSAQKAAEVALRESESRFRNIFEAGPIGMVLIEVADGRLRDVNPAFCAMLGYTADELKLMTFVDVTHPDSRPSTQEAFRKVVYNQLGMQGEEKKYLHKNGNVIWGYRTVTKISSAAGRTNYVLAMVQDITDRKRVELALQESEASLRLTLTGAQMGTYDWDMVRNTRVWSQKHEEIWGYEPGEFTGRAEQFYERVHPEDLPRVYAETERSIVEGKPYTHEIRVVWPDGSIHQVMIRGEVVMGEDKTPLRSRGVVIDMTEQRATEAAWEESKARLKVAASAAHMGIYDWDLIRDVRTWDSRHEAMWGYQPGEFDGSVAAFSDRIHPDDVESIMYEYNQAFGAEHDFQYEFRVLWPDGSVHWILSMGEPQWDQNGSLVRLLGVVMDITARKEAEAKVTQSQAELRDLFTRMKRTREEERIRVSREIHDELGQLLTSLKMDVRWLERKLSDESLPVAFNPLLDRAVGASEIADATIAAVQRIAAELRPGALDQLGLVSALAQELRRFTERSGILCRLNADPELKFPAGMSNELFFICREGLTNVARHAEARQVEISLRIEAEQVELELSDDGVGFDAEQIDAPGSLGLIGMRERAADCGGTWSVRNRPSGGTSIRVSIPVQN